MGNKTETEGAWMEETTREQNGIILRKTLSYRRGKFSYGILVAESDEPLTSVKVLINQATVIYRPDDPKNALHFLDDGLVFFRTLSLKELGEGAVNFNFRAENSKGYSAGMGGRLTISD